MKYTIFSIVFALVLSSLPLYSSAKDTIEFEEAKIIFEVNNSASDIGVQLKFDGDPWNKVKVFTPDGNLLFDVEGKGTLRNLGLTEHFNETHEPIFRGPDAETTLEDFLEMFPEGEYELKGKTVEGPKIEGTAELSHVLPCGPVITGPMGNPAPNNTVIAWQFVNTVIDPETGNCVSSPDINIVAYEVIVEVEDPLLRVFDVQLLPSQNSVDVPPQFLDFDTTYNFEVIAIQGINGEYGNQTITEGSFTTAEEL
ncbi:MAG: hypothetical protein ACREOW_12340 [Thermodesulfobacteriota bacterium]